MAAKVRFDGNSYIEIPTQASVQIFENVKVNFTWKVEGDVFTQSGTIMRPDGKTITLEALTFQRVRNAAVHSTNPAIGTWNQIFADYKGGDGKINPSFDKKTDTGMLIVTPTLWMRIDLNKNKFARASYGTYAFDGAGLFINIVFSSDPFRKGARLPLTQKFEGNKLEITSQGQTPAGTPAMVTDKFEKAQ